MPTTESADPDRRGTVAVLGSLNADLTVRVARFPQPGETLTGSELVVAAGGKSSNVAAAAAVLGSRVRLIGAVGDDDHGRFLRAEAERAGIDVDGVRRLPDRVTGTAMIVVDGAGENTIIVSPGANGALGLEAASPAAIGRPAVLCLGLEVPVGVVTAAAQTGRAAGALVLLNLSPYVPVPPALLEASDVVVVNRHEAAQLLGVGDLPADPASWPELPTPRTVVTLGSEGAVVIDRTAAEGERLVPVAPTAVEVIDTTGSGDAFFGALAHRLALGDALAEAAQVAARAGALAATRAGAQSSYGALHALR